MTQATTVTVSTPVDAHRVVSDLYARVLKPMTSSGKAMQITVCQAEDDRTVAANRYYWGVVLKEISEQAKIEGSTYMAEAWHELFKRQFLGYQIEKVVVAGSKRKRVRRSLRSTARLKVRAWHKYLDQVMAYAVTDLGVEFSEPPNWWR